MEITTHSLWTLIHGMGFGGLYLLACSGALVELWRRYAHDDNTATGASDERFLRIYLLAMTVLAWATVFTGAYVIYPWYRAVPPPGTANLTGFPQQLLLASPTTSAWHLIGMEWKEHVAWVVPISITMATAVFFEYGRNLRRHAGLRNAVLCFTAVSFLAAGIAGFFGAMLVKNAPVTGGATVRIVSGGEQ
jgi:hypothetical protein